MVEHLKIDGARLDQALTDIHRAREQFESEGSSYGVVAESVGHRALADALRAFGADWRIKREKLTQKLSDLEGKLRMSVDTFGEWDAAAARRGDEPAQAPSAGGGGSGGATQPAPTSGGAGGGAPAHAPTVPATPRGDGGPATVAGNTAPLESPAAPAADAGIPATAAGAVANGSTAAGDASHPDALDDVLDRLAQAVSGWQGLDTEEQALLFTSFGTAGLTLLVRAGRLPASVLLTGPTAGPSTASDPATRRATTGPGTEVRTDRDTDGQTDGAAIGSSDETTAPSPGAPRTGGDQFAASAPHVVAGAGSRGGPALPGVPSLATLLASGEASALATPPAAAGASTLPPVAEALRSAGAEPSTAPPAGGTATDGAAAIPSMVPMASALAAPASGSAAVGGTREDRDVRIKAAERVLQRLRRGEEKEVDQ